MRQQSRDGSGPESHVAPPAWRGGWRRVRAACAAAVGAVALVASGTLPAAVHAAPAASELAPAGLRCAGLIDLQASRPGPDYELRGWDYRWEVFNQEGVIQQPFGVALDGECNVYVANYSPTGGEMVKLSPTGATLARWGGPGKEPGQFERLEGVAVDPAGKVYAADSANGRLQRFAAPGQPDRLWASQFGCSRVAPAGVACQTVPQDASFHGNLAVGVDGAGNVYVVDGSYGIKKFAPSGGLAGRWGTFNSSEPGGFRQADGIAFDAQGNIYVADTQNNRVQKFAPDGAPLAQWGSKDGALRFNQPAGVAVDGAGMVYIADTDNHRVVALSPEGQVVRQWGVCAADGGAGGACPSARIGSAPGQFAQPHHLVANARGEIFVADRMNNRVQVLKAYPIWEQVPPPAPAPETPPAA